MYSIPCDYVRTILGKLLIYWEQGKRVRLAHLPQTNGQVAEYSFRREHNIQLQNSKIISSESWIIHCIIREPMRLTSTLIPKTRMMAHLEQVMETSYSLPQAMKKASMWEYTIVSIMDLSRTNYITYLHHVFSSCIPHPITSINFPACCASSLTPCTSAANTAG